jgi:acetylornithine deacetylase/succinyl-diaminopimelate desuccinylase-like protein
MSANDLALRVQAQMPRAREDLTRLVAFKSVADPEQFPPEECEHAAEYVVDSFRPLGFTDIGLHPTDDGSKAVVGHRPGPAGSPTVLLYCHYDVQPPLDESAWRSPAWELTERDGRWYGRGTADCKGNIAVHLTALRALGEDIPCSLKLVAEGSEEQGTGGLDRFVPGHAELLRADAILVCDTGNSAVGVPTLTTTMRGFTNVRVTVRTLKGAMHSGMFGGPAPDALTALIAMLATLHDSHGNTTIRGLDADRKWTGAAYAPEQFRADAGVLEGVELIGDGTVADMLWVRPSVSVLGIDCPPVIGAANALHAEVRAVVSLRIAPGVDAELAQDALVEHLRAAAPWSVEVELERAGRGAPFSGSGDGPALRAMHQAMRDAFGHATTSQGQGASIPLCNVLQRTFPDAEIMLLGVEEPRCMIHAPNESVDPSEIERIALAEARFLQLYAAAGHRR